MRVYNKSITIKYDEKDYTENPFVNNSIDSNLINQISKKKL